MDLSLFQTNSEGSTVQELAIPESNGTTSIGEDLLAQRFVLELLTDSGSLIYVPNRGTNFIKSMRYGVLNTWEIMGAFSSALLTIRKNFKEDETDDDPPEEKFAGASLDSVTLSGDSAFLEITITNEAGSANKVYLPLSFDI